MSQTGTKKLVVFATMLLILSAAFSPAQTPSQFDKNLEPIKSINFQAAEIRSVVRFLADHGDVNIVVSPEVEGDVTISLKDVNWRNALEIVGRTYNLAVVYEEAGYIRITPMARYREELIEMRKHHVEENSLVDLQTRIIKINNSTASAIGTAVESLISTRGKATADDRTNSVILQEVPENIERVVDFIKKLDQPPVQIKISAQLLEVSTDNLKELGVQWILNGGTGDLVADPVTGDPVQETRHQTSQTADLVSSPAGQFWVKTIQDGWDLEATISTMVSDGRGKILAHPEITTVENTEARIQMGQKVPIKQFDESGNTVIEFEEVGTLLRVTPHITADNKVLMHLMPERSTYAFDPNGVIINTSNAETNVVVENGQTAVIGGLTTQDETESSIGLPYLKDIPLLGLLFGYKQKKIVNRDLVIFVTPTIVEDFSAMAPPEPETTP